MRKKVMMLSCVAAVAIATFVGNKTYESNAYEMNDLLAQNVEALSQIEAVMGRTPTPGSVICTIYEGDSLVHGRLSICEQAAPLNKACVPGKCQIRKR